MLKSMTAFGRGRSEGEDKDITVEIKSVNSRYFDCTVKCPRVYSSFEEKIKAYIKERATSRGKVDVYITVDRHGSDLTELALDTALAENYIAVLRQLRDTFGLPDDVSVMRVAQNRELFVEKRVEEDLADEWARLLPVLDEAIAGYNAMRAAEGKKAEDDVRAKLLRVAAYAERVEAISEADTVGYRDKLEARLRQILKDSELEIEESRILTECAIFADRIAVDEELVRLRSHFGAFEEILAADEPGGRKLDFLMQELNRETNTIGSKANNAEIARLVVAMKAELEKIREQIQNVE